MQYRVYRICSIHACRMKTSMISTYDGTEHYCQQVKQLQKMALEGFHKSKLQDAVQLQTVLALYDHETDTKQWATEFIQV